MESNLGSEVTSIRPWRGALKMSKVLVVGYGNPLRSDDSVGIQAVRALKSTMENAAVEFVECQQLGVELASNLSTVDFAVFIDASTDGIAGEVRYEAIKPRGTAEAGLSHQADPGVILALSQQLYGSSPQAILVTIAGECFGFGTTLTPSVAEAMGGVIQRVAQLIKQRTHAHSAHA